MSARRTGRHDGAAFKPLSARERETLFRDSILRSHGGRKWIPSYEAARRLDHAIWASALTVTLIVLATALIRWLA